LKENILTAKRILACIKAGCSKNNLDNGFRYGQITNPRENKETA